MYQTSWQGIEFSSFSNPSSTNLAGPEFYQAFYEEFFRRYRNWEQLSPTWLKGKERCADFVLARSGVGAKILSVGCGLGAMEHYMHAQEPRHDLFIQEVAPTAWRWVGAEFTADRKYLGFIPACLPSGIQFDMVFLSSVDYALDDDALVDEKFLSDFTGYSLGKLRNDRYLKRGFDFVKDGSSVRYRAGTIRNRIHINTVRVSD